MVNEYEKLIISLIGMNFKGSKLKEFSLFMSQNLIYECKDFLAKIEKKFPDIIKDFQNKTIVDSLKSKINKWKDDNINFLLLGSNEYPQSLCHIYNPPLILFYKGVWPKNYDYNYSVAIVGSRKAGVMQAKFINHFSKILSASNICLISGLAQGIDAATHMGAISNTNSLFPTIAVLGSGLNYIYPSVHKYLAHKILECNGVLLSQFLPDTSPLPYNFLDRNRIISGLSKIVIVAQAAMKSGALSTARYALEQGRDLLAVLGPVYDEDFAGSNNLIMQGANPIASIDDFFRFYPNFLRDNNIDNMEDTLCDIHEKKVYEYIKKRKKVSREELNSKFQDIDLSLVIINLQSQDFIESLPGDEYCIV